MSTLKQLTGQNSGQVFELRAGATIIGRNPTRCQIVLEHHAVSREHARLESVNSQLFIEDLNSRNGVMVNGLQLPAGPTGRGRLFHSDQVDIAGFRFVVDDEPSSSTAVELISDDTAAELDILSTVEVTSDSSDWHLEENPAAKLKAVLRIINDLAHAIDLNEVLPKILESLFRSFTQAERAFILLRESPDGELKPVAAKRRDNLGGPIRSSRTIVDEAIARKSAVLTGDAMRDHRFASSESIHKLQLRSVMCAPLFDYQGEVLGVIQLEVTDPAKSFVRADLHMLAGVARHIAIVIENSRMHDAALRSQRNQFERRFQHLVEGSIQGIMVHRELEPHFCNEAWAALHGLSIEEVLDMDTIVPLIAESDRERLRVDAVASLRGPEPPHRYEYRALRQNGSSIWLENLVTIVDWEGEPAILSTVLNISDRKRAEAHLHQTHAELEQRVAERTAELARERDLLRTLMDHLPDYVFIKDREGRFITTNAAHMKLLGADSLDDVRNKTDFDFFPPQIARDFYRDEQEILRTGQILINHEELLGDPDGEEQWVLTTKAPWRDADGNIIGIVGMTRDITAMKQAAQVKEHFMAELQRSHRELEQFAAVAAHDLQEPLRAVSVFCELLRKHLEGKLDTEASEMMCFIVDGAKRMQMLIDALRTYAKITATRRPRLPVDGNAVLDESLANLKAAITDSGATVEAQRLPTVVADAPQLMQVFQNLVANAIKFQGPEPLRVAINALEMDDSWRFSVTDNGIGIEPQHFERIFQIFQRVERNDERPGTGIGLAICQKVIEQHGGKIWVESQPGIGSTFFFTLPKVPQ